MSNPLTRLARRASRRLPDSWKTTVRAARLDRSYDDNTAGIVPDAQMLEWFRHHGRPVSIVIPSYNDIALIAEALASIEETCRDVTYEVIIVDDFINPDVAAQLQSFASTSVRVILKDRRVGFAGTVNVGMADAAHDIILLNSDIVAKPGWVQALQYSAYALDPSIGMVSPMLVYPDGRIQYGGTYYARLLAPQWFGHLHVGSPATRSTARVPGYNRSVSGACVYITRAAFERVGLLDDEYWLGFEDVDYGLRAWDLGVRCYYQPAALLVHHESASRGYSQGHRELASMRRFWRRWQERLLTRRLPEDPTIDFVLGSGATPIWTAYVESLADVARAAGRRVAVHRTALAPIDEDLVALLAKGDGVVVACDWTVAESVWLATVNSGLPVYLLPAMESVLHPHDPARQAAIVAGYRSEFDYIAPNRWTQRQLQAEAAWEVRARITPALAPMPLPEGSSAGVVTIGATFDERSAVELIVRRNGGTAVHLNAVDDLVQIASIALSAPRAIIDFGQTQSSLVPFSLMSIGAVYLAPSEARVSHEVLDGYNALTFSRGDLDAMSRSLGDALERDEVWGELRVNGHESASRAAAVAGHEFLRALGSFGDVVA